MRDKDSERKLFDIVLVWKLDRFARNRYDSARYKTQLKKNSVKLMSATEAISDGLEGIILESVLEGCAEYYSADLAEKLFAARLKIFSKAAAMAAVGHLVIRWMLNAVSISTRVARKRKRRTI